jgi:hypothetical protein
MTVHNNFVLPKVPNSYSVRNETRVCNDCGCNHNITFSAGDDLVAFQDTKSGEVRWLPTYEEGGFLDLLRKLVPDYSDEQGITHRVSQDFEKVFDRIQERISPEGVFRIQVVRGCPNCGSRKVIVERSTIEKNPSVEWIRYDLSRASTPTG